jgi:hypothetical protein
MTAGATRHKGESQGEADSLKGGVIILFDDLMIGATASLSPGPTKLNAPNCRVSGQVLLIDLPAPQLLQIHWGLDGCPLPIYALARVLWVGPSLITCESAALNLPISS